MVFEKYTEVREKSPLKVHINDNIPHFFKVENYKSLLKNLDISVIIVKAISDFISGKLFYSKTNPRKIFMWKHYPRAHISDVPACVNVKTTWPPKFAMIQVILSNYVLREVFT